MQGRPNLTLVAGALLFAGVGLSLASACGGSVGAGGLDAGTDVALTEASARPRRPDAGPNHVPSPFEGWDRLHSYCPDCGLYYPRHPSYLPEPIRWEPCRKSAEDGGSSGPPGPPGLDCRRMVTAWTDARGKKVEHMLASVKVAFDPNGKLLIAFVRDVGGRRHHLVAEADGATRYALMTEGSLALTDVSLSGSNVIYRVDDDMDVSGHAGGAVGGPIDELEPRVYRPFGGDWTTYVAGTKHFVEGPRTIKSIVANSVVAELVVPPADRGAYYDEHLFLANDDLFFAGQRQGTDVVKVWTAGGGMRTLIGDIEDLTRTATSFTTDGVDMAWIEAFGRPPEETIFPHAEIWTAKHTTDPAVAQASRRRVRSEYRLPHWPVAVGCGYAATSIFPPSDWGQGGFRLVRLADGYSWEIVDRDAGSIAYWTARYPLAITCDEIFVGGSILSAHEVMRIRIDSLGGGVPAD